MRALGARPAAFIYPRRTFQKGPPLFSAPANPLARPADLSANGSPPEPTPSVTPAGRGRGRGRPVFSNLHALSPRRPPPRSARPPPATERGGAPRAREPIGALQRPRAGGGTGWRGARGRERQPMAARRRSLVCIFPAPRANSGQWGGSAGGAHLHSAGPGVTRWRRPAAPARPRAARAGRVQGN